METQAITIRLTQGAIENGYLKLTGHLEFFPKDAVGGANRTRPGRQLFIDFGQGLTATTDIAGDKGILRERSAVRSFVVRERATAGTTVRMERRGPYHYAVSVVSAAARNTTEELPSSATRTPPAIGQQASTAQLDPTNGLSSSTAAGFSRPTDFGQPILPQAPGLRQRSRSRQADAGLGLALIFKLIAWGVAATIAFNVLGGA